MLEVNDAVSRAKYELNYGILTKYQQLRTKQLEERAAKECYGNSKLSYLEAEECEAFIYKNDYKMKQINSFWGDHIPIHLLNYNKCVNAANTQSNTLEKEMVFKDCHKNWVGEFKHNTAYELELRARKLLGKNLE